jgi:hypothetical protein
MTNRPIDHLREEILHAPDENVRRHEAGLDSIGLIDRNRGY